MLHMHFLFVPCVDYMSDVGFQLVHKVATGVNSDKQLPFKSANVRMASHFWCVRSLAVPIIPAVNSSSTSTQKQYFLLSFKLGEDRQLCLRLLCSYRISCISPINEETSCCMHLCRKRQYITFPVLFVKQARCLHRQPLL